MHAKHRGRQKYREYDQHTAQQQQDVGPEVESLARCQRRANRHEHGGGALGGVQVAVVLGRVLATEKVSAKSRKQREDLAPAEEGERAEDNEQQWVAGKAEEHVNGDSL